jgi:hypothetical protein
MTKMTTRIEAANARAAEGEAAWTAGDYGAAARDFTLAAEQFEAIWHEMHGHRGASPDAGHMRRRAREAVQRRDAAEQRIKLEGRIGGWQ